MKKIILFVLLVATAILALLDYQTVGLVGVETPNVLIVSTFIVAVCTFWMLYRTMSLKKVLTSVFTGIVCALFTVFAVQSLNIYPLFLDYIKDDGLYIFVVLFMIFYFAMIIFIAMYSYINISGIKEEIKKAYHF